MGHNMILERNFRTGDYISRSKTDNIESLVHIIYT